MFPQLLNTCFLWFALKIEATTETNTFLNEAEFMV
jgi:hypothetical protein